MLQTRIIEYKLSSSATGRYLAAAMTDSRAMYNTANFYVRNTMTGIQKDPSERTANETEVLHYVFTGIHKANELAAARKAEILRQAGSAETSEERDKLIAKADKVRFSKYPDEKNWFLPYETLDAIFKATANPVYMKMSSQVNQNAIRKLCKSWKSYFTALKDYRKYPSKYLGKPKLPGYIKEPMTTAWFTNQAAKISFSKDKAVLSFVNLKETAVIGTARDFDGIKYVKTEVKPYHGDVCCILVTTDDGIEIPKAPEHPERIIGIDPGVSNFAAVTNNFGIRPFLIKGGAVKAENQWFNKRRSILISELTKGRDSSRSVKHSRSLSALSRKRDDRLRDMFYKYAWRIVNFAEMHHAEVIVFGKNEGWKQNSSMTHESNQAFVSIPFEKFRQILVNTAAKKGIPVITTEESYTSKASFIDEDKIPVYVSGRNDTSFSGRRLRRGLYLSKNGTVINADVNGSANIIRKMYPYAFEGVDISYMWKTTDVIKFSDVYAFRKMNISKHHKRHRHSESSRYHHSEMAVRLISLKEAFNCTKNIYKKAKN